MNKNELAFSKMNLIICAISVIIIIVGFVLMTGSATTIENGFDPDIFSTRRIIIAPITCFIGFLLMIYGILYPVKNGSDLTDKA